MQKMTFFTYSFGCRVNQAEKELIDKELIDNGLIFDENEPDLYIINSCAVTQKAERETRQLIYQVKKAYPKTKIILTGCAATYWKKNNLYKNLPVDLLISNTNKKELVKTILNSKFGLSQRPLFHRSGGIRGGISSKFLNSGRLMIKIQDGCNRFCTYCIVPYLRGNVKSTKINKIINIINEFKTKYLINEVILTAINTDVYGKDTGETLIQLIKKVLTDSSISRISFGSIHPWSINEDFLKYYKSIYSNHKFVNFFHIPIQSASNKVLKLMKRGYKIEEIIDKMDQIKAINSFAFIATDIIVGFFDEDDSDFEDTYNFLKESPIVKFHVFRYSKRDNTAGFYMAKRLKEPSPKEKAKRAKALIELGKRKYEQFLQKNVGRESTVILLEKKNSGYQEGLLDNQLPILIDITPRVTPRRCNGGLRRVKITGFKNGKLFGRIIKMTV